MRASKKNKVYSMCDYVLSGDSEYKACLDVMKNYQGLSKIELRQRTKEHIWYMAYSYLHGEGDANKKLTEMITEVRG